MSLFNHPFHFYGRLGAAVFLTQSISNCDSIKVDDKRLSNQQSQRQNLTDYFFPSQDHYFICPKITQGVNKSNFIIKYNSTHRNPQWVLEHLNNRAAIVQESRKNMHFFPEPSIRTESFQVFNK